MAVTMNLRTRSSYGSKQKKTPKVSEKLLDLVHEEEFCDPCKEVISKLNDHTSTFDIQANILRQNIQKISSTHHSNCDFMKVVVFWYFNLGSNSSLRSIIASSLNKLQDESGLINIFDEYIKETISQHSQLLVEVIQRCFENCSPALSAVQENLNQLYEVFIDDLQNNKNHFAGYNVDALIRVLLALESQGKCQNEDLLKAIFTYFHENINEIQMSGETKRNLALIWTHEIRHRYSNDFVKLLVDYILEKEVEESFKVSIFLPISLIISYYAAGQKS